MNTFRPKKEYICMSKLSNCIANPENNFRHKIFLNMCSGFFEPRKDNSSSYVIKNLQLENQPKISLPVLQKLS